jgi:hypothetical protein
VECGRYGWHGTAEVQGYINLELHPEKEKLDKQSEVLGTASYRLGKMQC